MFFFWKTKDVVSGEAPQVPLFLQNHPGSALSAGVRRLSNTYTGGLIRVRETAGNTETDISYNASGDLDTSALLAHCGLASGRVVTFYDQTGNGNHLTQSTASLQPYIVESGTLIELNSKPALRASASDGAWMTAGTGVFSAPTDLTAYGAWAPVSSVTSNARKALWALAASASERLLSYYGSLLNSSGRISYSSALAGAGFTETNNTGTYSAGGVNILTHIINGSGKSHYVNGSLIGSDAGDSSGISTSSELRVFDRFGTAWLGNSQDTYLQEIHFYTAARSTGIETDLQGVYLP